MSSEPREVFDLHVLPLPEGHKSGRPLVLWGGLVLPGYLWVAETIEEINDAALRAAQAWFPDDFWSLARAVQAELDGKKVRFRYVGDPFEYSGDLLRLVVAMHALPFELRRDPESPVALYHLRKAVTTHWSRARGSYPSLREMPEESFRSLTGASRTQLDALADALRVIPPSPAAAARQETSAARRGASENVMRRWHA